MDDRTILRLTAATLALLLVATSCSGGDDSVAATTVTTEPTIGTLPPDDPAGTPESSAAPSPDDPSGSTTSQPEPSPSLTPLDEVTVQLDVEPQLLGYAGTQGLTGGLGHDVVMVTTTADSGAGSYREALSGGDRIVRFDPSLDGEVIHLQSPVEAPGSNVTLDGSGVDVWVQGRATRFSGTNVVVAGMTFKYNDGDGPSDGDGDDDAVTFRDADGKQVAGLFGNQFSYASDGLVDVIWNHGHDVYVTMCGNFFGHHNKAVLIDSGDDEYEGGKYHVTMCRNAWNDVYQRAPLSRRAHVHQFNSLFERYGDASGDGGGSKAGGDGSNHAEHLLENNMAIPRAAGEQTWDGTDVTQPRTEWAGTQIDSDGVVRASGSWLGSVDGLAATEMTTTESDIFEPPYDYPLVTAGPQLADVIRATAGVCRPVEAERVSPCAPLVVRDDPDGSFDVLIEGASEASAVESVVVEVGDETIEAVLVEAGRWRVPLSSLGAGPSEVRAHARLADGGTISSDVAIVALVS